MDKETIQIVYKRQVQKLVEDIKIIMSEAISKSKKSDKIMERLREESVRIPVEYVNSFLYTRASLSAILKVPFTLEQDSEINIDEKDKYNENIDLILNKLNYHNLVTIDPSKLKETDYKGDIATIRGNSFGPYFAEKYFEENTFRIVWILKESYIEKDSYLTGERGGRNQAADYSKYFKDNGDFDNPTFDNILKLSRSLLIYAGKIENGASDEEVLKHICILEANHFPGLAFNSTNSDDKLIELWTNHNRFLIETLIEFFNPKLIIGCQTIMGTFTPNTNFLNWLSDKNNGEIPYKKGEEWYYDNNGIIIAKTLLDNKIIRPWGGSDKHSMVKTEDGRYWINAYHSASRNYNILSKNIEKFARDILEDENHNGI